MITSTMIAITKIGMTSRVIVTAHGAQDQRQPMTKTNAKRAKPQHRRIMLCRF